MTARLIQFPSHAVAVDSTDEPDDAPYTGPAPTFAPDATTYTVEQVAYLISLSVDLTREYVENGTIPAIQTADSWEIPRAQFREWVDNLPEA
ncbi:excisionase family DNA-binding protein [Amycolatopsis japonica]